MVGAREEQQACSKACRHAACVHVKGPWGERGGGGYYMGRQGYDWKKETKDPMHALIDHLALLNFSSEILRRWLIKALHRLKNGLADFIFPIFQHPFPVVLWWLTVFPYRTCVRGVLLSRPFGRSSHALRPAYFCLMDAHSLNWIHYRKGLSLYIHRVSVFNGAHSMLQEAKSRVYDPNIMIYKVFARPNKSWEMCVQTRPIISWISRH